MSEEIGQEVECVKFQAGGHWRFKIDKRSKGGIKDHQLLAVREPGRWQGEVGHG